MKKKSPAIDLTRATLAASLKYPWHRDIKDKNSAKYKKFSAYRLEADDLAFARQGHAEHDHKTLEAELMDWADDVAYSVHDITDFHRCNSLPWAKFQNERTKLIEHICAEQDVCQNDIEEAYDTMYGVLNGIGGELLNNPYEGTRAQQELMRRLTSTLVSRFIKAVKVNPDTGEDKAVVIDQRLKCQMIVLKQITRNYILTTPALAAKQYGYRTIIRGLFDAIVSECTLGNDIPPFLPSSLHYLREYSEGKSPRFAADCIASLTEKEAVGLHSRLMGTSVESVLNPIVR